MNNMKQIALALHLYEDLNGTLPAATVFDSKHQPISSWRFSILSNLEHSVLYNSCDPNQAWNSAKNQPFTSLSVDCYQCPADIGWSVNLPRANYFAVVGSDTMWPEGRGRRLDEVTDPHDKTILVLEAGWNRVSWAEPKDFTFEEAIDFLTIGQHAVGLHPEEPYRPGFFYKPLYEPSSAVHVAMVDGTVRWLPLPLSRETAVALLTCNGGETVEDFDKLTEPQLDYGRIWGLAVFVLLSLAPIGKRFLRKQATQTD